MNGDPLDTLARDLYNQWPALSPFTRTPIPYDTARELGINSWARAHTAASKQIEEGAADA